MLHTERTILASGTELNVARGEYLFRRQQEAEYVFYLKDGALELADGGATTRILKGGSYFLGLEEMLLNRCHPYSARVLQGAVVLVFEKALIESLLQRYAEARRYFLRKMCDHLAQQERVFE